MFELSDTHFAIERVAILPLNKGGVIDIKTEINIIVKWASTLLIPEDYIDLPRLPTLTLTITIIYFRIIKQSILNTRHIWSYNKIQLSLRIITSRFDRPHGSIHFPVSFYFCAENYKILKLSYAKSFILIQLQWSFIFTLNQAWWPSFTCRNSTIWQNSPNQ